MIPDEVRSDARITEGDAMTYGDILSLASGYGYCFASNKHLADIRSVSVRTINRSISNLSDCGFIRIEKKYDGFKVCQRRIYPAIVITDKQAKPDPLRKLAWSEDA